EITGSDPVGHLNVLFIKDCNDYMPKKRNFSETEADSLYNPQNHPSTFLKRSVSILRFFSKTKRLF
ncbi:MAG: hypothetical protein E7K32_14530, partial [Bacteroides stercoris]|nr:hypothetical protein [Bacteroides stercoris]